MTPSPPADRLRASIGQAFAVAASELGMCSAAWLFVRDCASEGGVALVEALRDRLGREYPVLDSVAAAWIAEPRELVVEIKDVLVALRGIEQLCVIGLETRFLDVLIPQLDCEIALLTQGEFATDWSRVLSNYDGRVAATDLASFQSLAGHRSALLTFAYGVRGPIAHVPALWLRVIGSDVRTQFRSLIAWDVLGAGMYVYPRWLGETLTAGFSQVI